MSVKRETSYDKELEQINEFAEKFSEWFSRHQKILFIIIIIVALILWLLSGVYIVHPGEEGVVRTFGRFSSVTVPVLNYHWPRPIPSVPVVDFDSVRRAEIGFRTGCANLIDENLS